MPIGVTLESLGHAIVAGHPYAECHGCGHWLSQDHIVGESGQCDGCHDPVGTSGYEDLLPPKYETLDEIILATQEGS